MANFLMPWELYGADVANGEHDLMGSIMNGGSSLSSSGVFVFDPHVAARDARHLIQSEAFQEQALSSPAVVISEEPMDDTVVEPALKQPKRARATLRKAMTPSAKLALLLVSWLAILAIDPSSSEAGRTLEEKETEAGKLTVVEAFVAGKAVNTLAARLSSIMRFVTYFGEKKELWPPSVKSIKCFVESVLVNAAPTALQRFLEALAFLYYTFRFGRGTLDASTSLYFQGLANLNMRKLGLRKQASPIPFEVVANMESMLADPNQSDLVRVIAGAMLFLIYLRARVNDLAVILSCTLFSEFVELDSEGAKTSSKDRLRTSFVGPRETLTGLDIWSIYIKVRDDLGIPLVGGALFPSLDADGVWHNTQAVMQDILSMVRMICEMCGMDSPHLVGTHSGKVTFLDAAVIYGILKEVRTRLGYHKVAGERSVNSYARDNLVQPMQEVTRMIRAARAGEFDPRSGRLTKQSLADSVAPTQQDPPDEEELKDWFDEPELEVQVEDELADTNIRLVELWTTKCRGDNRLFRHKGTGRTHRGDPDSLQHTACHYYLTECYERLAVQTDEDPEENLTLCKNCFGRNTTVGRQLVRKLSRPLVDNLLELEDSDLLEQPG